MRAARTRLAGPVSAMKLTPQELAHIEVLIARAEVNAIAAGTAQRPDPEKPSRYADLIALRRVRFRKSGD